MRVAPPMIFEGAQHRYAFERELAGGGMATVYLARDLQDGARVAIKVLRPEMAPVLGTERFRREIRITARLAHPNIIPVLDSGEVDHLPFYVTPYVAGETLADRLKRESQLPVGEAVTIACRITEALEAAHSEGFVHRDIKPSNILLAGDRVILADFGLARAVDVISAEQLTESGIVIGTPAYMSPEQSASGARVDVRSDIYSLGCVIYEMLAGAPPFTGPTTQSLLARHAVDPVPSLRTVRGTVSALTVFPFDSLAPLERPYLPIAEVMAQAGQPRRAREMLAQYERDVEPRYRRMAEPDKHTRHTAQGELALAEGRVPDAITEFRAWSETGQCLGCGLTALARAYTRAGLPDSAVAAYERYLSTMWMERVMIDADELAPAYRELGTLYADRGDTVRARHAYGRFLELWKDADPELRPQVTWVRRRLAELTPAP